MMLVFALGTILVCSTVLGLPDDWPDAVASGPMAEPYYPSSAGPLPEPYAEAAGPTPYYPVPSGPLPEPYAASAGSTSYYPVSSGPLPEAYPAAAGPEPYYGAPYPPGLIPGSVVVDVEVIEHPPIIVNKEVFVPECGYGTPYFG